MILSENHLMIREMARQFAEKELTREVLDEAEATNSFLCALLNGSRSRRSLRVSETSPPTVCCDADINTPLSLFSYCVVSSFKPDDGRRSRRHQCG